ncbi:MAG: hypothetical protein ACYDEA_01355 [Candidatus Dormibacteria bacterium]
MHVEHDFVVPSCPGQAWKLLPDIEQLAQRLPGAALREVDGHHFAMT